jgi:hypothetical protein
MPCWAADPGGSRSSHKPGPESSARAGPRTTPTARTGPFSAAAYFRRASRFPKNSEWSTRAIGQYQELASLAALGVADLGPSFFADTKVPSTKHSSSESAALRSIARERRATNGAECRLGPIDTSVDGRRLVNRTLRATLSTVPPSPENPKNPFPTRARGQRRPTALRLRLGRRQVGLNGRPLLPRRAWAPPGVRPLVAARVEREYGYAYAAVSPHDGALTSLVLPEVNAVVDPIFWTEN